jgi:hypothetical protein
MNDTIKKISLWVAWLAAIANWVVSALETFPKKPDGLSDNKPEQMGGNGAGSLER